MNAGAYGGEMKDVLESVTVLTGEGKIIELGRNELELGYRTSVIAKKGYIVLGAVLKLERGDGEKIKTYMDELKEKRVTKQPLEYPSAGSTFKRPEGYFAGKLIEDAGLRGFQVGGALDFMVLNRRYEVENSEIKDLTTYIDPQKYIEIFADTSIDSQNFWVQTVVQATRRGNYSAKQIPFL